MINSSIIKGKKVFIRMLISFGILIAIQPTALAAEKIELSMTGTKGDDILESNEGNYLLVGLEGDDTLIGSGGNNKLIGGDGNDTIIGSKGNDVLIGGNGDDVLNGFEGDDILEGNAGNDLLNGGDGNDLLSGQEGDDMLSGLEGDDKLIGGNGNDIGYGGQGSDLFFAGNGNDTGIYILADNLLNPNAVDKYDGGPGYDTLQIMVSQSDLFALGIVIEDIRALFNRNKSVADFKPLGFNLIALNFEYIEIFLFE